MLKYLSIVCVARLILGAPAFAQAPGPTAIEVEGRGLLDRYIALFNKGDVAGMARDVYVAGDEAALSAMFVKPREDSFGKLDVYGVSFCSRDATHGKALLKYGRLFTYGGLMDGDEGRVFDLVKTDAGWRIAGEAGVAYDAALNCR